MSRPLRGAMVALAAGLLAWSTIRAEQETRVLKVPSRDGTSIAVECAGSGPRLLIVHGGLGDRTRWTPMFPLLAPHFTVCAMDRRGRGGSGDSPEYSIHKEAEDIAAVAESGPGPVFLLGHSYGGLCALEAAFLTPRIAKLLLYEPPLQERIDAALVDRLEGLIRSGDRDQAVAMFLREVVKVPDPEIDAMRQRPVWRALVDSIHAHPRQMRALGSYRFDAKRVSALLVPTLLIRGAETTVPDVKLAFEALMAALPNRTTAVLEGQHHNAMDTGREQLAMTIRRFLIP